MWNPNKSWRLFRSLKTNIEVAQHCQSIFCLVNETSSPYHLFESHALRFTPSNNWERPTNGDDLRFVVSLCTFVFQSCLRLLNTNSLMQNRRTGELINRTHCNIRGSSGIIHMGTAFTSHNNFFLLFFSSRRMNGVAIELLYGGFILLSIDL